MNSVIKKDTTPNEIYVKRCKNFVHPMGISKMLFQTNITIHSNNQ